jgi:hypothetical protein
MVCPNDPGQYAKRLKEIRGFTLENIERCAPVNFERLDGYAPLIHHAYSRRDAFSGEVVAVSLYELLDRNGAPRYVSRSDIAKQFRIRSDAKLIVSGVHVDSMLERIWRSTHRESIAIMLRSLDVSLLTSPNFSVYNNVPRTENLYNIKRNALIAQEFLERRVPVALHINACTDTDYLRYAKFLTERPEFEAISFEFITGPGYPSRVGWHVKKLIDLSTIVARPLQLILRGGTSTVGILSRVFANLIVIDSDPLQRALRRKRMIFGNDGRMKYIDNRLPEGEPIDNLLVENALAAKAEVEYAIRENRLPKVIRRRQHKLASAGYADHKSRQLSLLADASHRESRANATNNKRVVAAPKSEKTT